MVPKVPISEKLKVDYKFGTAEIFANQSVSKTDATASG